MPPSVHALTARMMTFLKLGTPFFWKQPLAPKPMSARTYPALDASLPLEEERLPHYNAADWYPVFIGEVFLSRYQVLGKLGFGLNSTVWLSRDLQSHDYVALRLYNVGNHRPGQPPGYMVDGVHREVDAYKRMSATKSSHPGQKYVRKMLDSFTLEKNGNVHHCLVHEPLWDSLLGYQRRVLRGRLTEDLLRLVLIDTLQALDYLHTECHIIHTDVKPSNIMLKIPDKSLLKDFEDTEDNTPSPRKILEDRTIYKTREFSYTIVPGNLVLCDFGEARYGGEKHVDLIQPDIYRAPEVIFDIPWSYSADIWMVGVMLKIWDMFEDHHLFDADDPETEKCSLLHHLAEMVALLGPPPKAFLEKAKNPRLCFDEQGNWTSDIVPVPYSHTLEASSEAYMGGNKGATNKKAGFLRFVRSMLQWDPAARKTAKELLAEDPWLNGRVFNVN